MFMIHERKLNSTHQVMFRECIKKIPSLKNAQCPIVVDKEKAIMKAIQVELPSTPLLLCWNHIFRDVRTWCRKHGAQSVRTWCHKHGAQSSDITIYVTDLKKLFHMKTPELYENLFHDLKKDWDSSFEEYYRKEIHSYVHSSIGCWVLEENKVYNPL